MSLILKQYISAGALTLLAKVVTVMSVFAEIFCLNIVLGKSGYGDFAYALAITLLAATIIANSVRSLIVYKVSASPPSFAQLYSRQCLTLSMVLALIIMGLMVFFSDFLVQYSDNHNAHIWINLFIWIIPMEIMRHCLIAYLQSRQNIKKMILMNTVSLFMLRFLGLAVIYLFAIQNPLIIACLYFTAFALPPFYLMWCYKLWPTLSGRLLSLPDFRYGLTLIATQFVHQFSRTADLFLVGIFLVSMFTAEYVVAMKFAAILLIGKQMTEHLLTPRISSENALDVTQEYAATRHLAFLIAVAGILFFAIFGAYILSAFGDYSDRTYELFFVLAAVMMCRVSTGNAGEYLLMKGHSRWVFYASVLSCTAALISAIMLMPALSVYGAAIAAFIGALVGSTAMIFGCWHTERFVALPPLYIGITAATVITCIGIGLSMIIPMVGGAIMVVILTVLVYCDRHYWRSALSLWKGIKNEY